MNIFGTDGVREQVGKGLLTAEKLHFLGKALGKWLCEKHTPHPDMPIKIMIASDTRISSDFVISALSSGILLFPIKIFYQGIMPTPALSHILTKNTSFTAGIMISASHNIYSDNGIKVITGSGKISCEDELRLSEFFDQFAQNKLPSLYTTLGTIDYTSSYLEKYKQFVLSLFPAHFLKNKKIVLDLAHGATYKIAPDIFRLLGATIITINDEPNGININNECGATNTKLLKNEVLNYKADIGFAFDGDGDRLMIINAAGELKDGDDILALLSCYSEYKNQNILVSTVMSNQGLEDYFLSQGKHLVRTSVGDKYVAQALISESAFLGAEQSGHIILRDLNISGDGILAALRVCQAATELRDWSCNLFYHYPQILINIHVTHKKDLASGDLARLIKAAENRLVKGRVLVRYSGTENLLRIMVEEIEEVRAQSIAKELAENLKLHLN